MEGLQKLAHLLGVEPFGDRRRVHEVDEHDRDLPPLGAVDRPAGQRRGGAIEEGNRPQEALAIAQRHAERLEILLGEIGQDVPGDAIGREGLGIGAEAQLLKPASEFFDHGSTCLRRDAPP